MQRKNGDHLPHILGTSANLFGICAVLITGLHFSNAHLTTMADEVLLMTSFLLFGSCVLSYFSIRTRNLSMSGKLERVADYVFLAGMLSMLTSLTLLTFMLV